MLDSDVVNFSDHGPRILCMMRIRNEEDYIAESIRRSLELCYRVLIFDDHSTDRTVDICQSFGDRVELIQSPFRDVLDEVRDKNYLLKAAISRSPEWILAIDGDEVLEMFGPEAILRALNEEGISAYKLKIAYLWDGVDRIRVDGFWGKAWRPSLFKVAGQPLDRLRFDPTEHGGNLHCGNSPGGIVGEIAHLPVLIKHYGYITAEVRKAKYEFYNSVDRDNEIEFSYVHLIGPGVKAPGPIRLEPWDEASPEAIARLRGPIDQRKPYSVY